MKKKLKILAWLKKNGKETLGKGLEMVGENTSIPIVSNILDNIGEALQGQKDITPEQIEEAKLIIEADLKEFQQISDRWKSDNEQELKLPKLIRPIILAYTWLLLTVLIVLDVCGLVIQSEYISTFQILALAVNSAYFGARTIEKYHKEKFKS